MHTDDDLHEGMFGSISPEERVPADRPFRPIREMVDEILKEMSPMFAKLMGETISNQAVGSACGACRTRRARAVFLAGVE
jgi:hypothetical protein